MAHHYHRSDLLLRLRLLVLQLLVRLQQQLWLRERHLLLLSGTKRSSLLHKMAATGKTGRFMRPFLLPLRSRCVRFSLFAHHMDQKQRQLHHTADPAGLLEQTVKPLHTSFRKNFGRTLYHTGKNIQ